MFSAEKSKREESIERSKYSSGVQILLGAALVACAAVAVVKENYYYANYYIGGFVSGVLGFFAGALGVYLFQKATDFSGDDPTQFRNQLGCKLVVLKILMFVVIMASISGIMTCVMFLAVGDSDDNNDADDELQILVILAACILVAHVLLDCAILFTLRLMDPCCTNNQAVLRTYPDTAATTATYQNSTAPTGAYQPVFSTQGFGAQQNVMYPVSQNQSGGYAPPQPPPYGFKSHVLAPQQPTGPPPAYSY